MLIWTNWSFDPSTLKSFYLTSNRTRLLRIGYTIRPLCGGWPLIWSSTSWTSRNFSRFGGPSTLWVALYRRVVRPLRGRFRTVRLGSIIISTVFMVRPLLWAAFYRVDDPFTLWWLCRPMYGLYKTFSPFWWSVHFVAAIPSTLWTCKIIHRFGWSVHFLAAIPSTLWTCKIIHRFGWSVHFVDSFFLTS